MKLIFSCLVIIFLSGCESMSVTHVIPSNYKPLERIGIVFNSSNDVCVFGKKYSNILNHKNIVLESSKSSLNALGFKAAEVKIRDYGVNTETLTERLPRSNTAKILSVNEAAYQNIMADFDILLVMEHDSISENWLQRDCFGAISIMPREGHTQYGSFALKGDDRNMAYSPPIMWIFKRGDFINKGVGVYFHKIEGVPFPFSNPKDKDGVERFISFYKQVIETEIKKAFINFNQVSNI